MEKVTKSSHNISAAQKIMGPFAIGKIDSLTHKDSDDYIIKFVTVWFPVSGYFSAKELLPSNTIYENLLYFWKHFKPCTDDN